MNIHAVRILADTTAVAALTLLFCFIPELTRPGIFFSVTVDPAFRKSDAGRRILAGYRRAVTAGGALGIALVLLLARASTHWSPLAAPFVIALSMWTYARYRRQVLPHGLPLSPVREASLASRGRLAEDRLWVQALPFVPLLVALTILARYWDRLPARFPVHWGWGGRPDRWVAKTPWHVVEPIMVGAILCVFVAVLVGFCRKWTRRPGGDALSLQADALFRSGMARMILACEAVIASVFGTIALAPLLGSEPARRLVLTLLPCAVLLLTAGLVIWAARISRQRSRIPVAGGDLTPDACWKAGFFYFNPGDPAIFVEKRTGLGYTFNFAHPTAWIILGGAIIVIPALALIFSR